MASRELVLDANILIRGARKSSAGRSRKVCGQRIVFIPESAYTEAEEHLAALITKRGGDPAKGLIMLPALVALADLITTDLYGDYEVEARKRLDTRGP